MVQLSHPYMTTGKTTALTIQIPIIKVMSLLFNMLSRFVIAFLIHCLGLLWILCQGASIFFRFVARVTICSDFGAQENKFCHCFNHLMSSLAQSLVEVLWGQGFVCAFWVSLVGLRLDSKCDCTPPNLLVGASPLPLGVEYFIFGGMPHSPVDGCSAASCNFKVLAEEAHTSFYSTILEQEQKVSSFS